MFNITLKTNSNLHNTNVGTCASNGCMNKIAIFGCDGLN